MTRPRISLVTPVRNSAPYIEQTFHSVFSQNYPHLEYFVIDGGSTDGTIDIIKKHESRISGWLSEPDNGMYDALNKGFARTSGEIMGWISATDILQPGGLNVVASVFQQFPEIEWITGRPAYINERAQTCQVNPVPRWSRIRFLAGFNRHIQQESTFWRRSLWQKAGGRMEDKLRMGGDFELWVRFFRHARLYSVDALIGAFRGHEASLGLQRLDECHDIHDQIINAELQRISHGSVLRAFRAVNSAIKKIRGVRFFWWHLIERPFAMWPGPDRPPVIRQDPRGDWRLDS